MQSDSSLISAGDTFVHEFRLTHEDVRSFINLSGDSNNIHLDEIAAAECPIGKIAAPGMLSALVFSRVLGTMFPGHGTVYRSQSLDFKRPVLIGPDYIARFTVKEVIPARHRAIIETVIAEKETSQESLSGVAVVINFKRL